MALELDKSYAINPDDVVFEQFEECKNHDFVKAAALMPDAHAGYAAPIGSVIVTEGKIVPAWVGFDIGCGMTSAHLKNVSFEEVKEKVEEIYKRVQQYVPMGMGNIQKNEKHLTDDTKLEFQELINTFKDGEYDKSILNFLQSAALRHVGTLGDGNHFIEVGHDEDEIWITVHSGSRGIGYKVAEKYMIKSANDKNDFQKTYPLDVESELGRQYLNVLDFGLDFALLNRKEIIKQSVQAISEVLEKEIDFEIWTNKNHNHAIPIGNNRFVHRKGATPAKLGERGVIPANMRDGCFLVEGLGNKDFLDSSSHGAGRLLSRKGATKKISMEEFKESMKGIKGTVSEGTLDEAPMAYKNIYDVMEAQKESVKVVKRLVPVINWKGERFRRKNAKKDESDK